MDTVTRFYALISVFPTLLTMADFCYFLNQDKRLLRWGSFLLEIMILIVPFILLIVFEEHASIKTGWGLFPSHELTFYTLIAICQLAYFYSTSRVHLSAGIIELLINCLLLTGVAMNIMMAILLDSVLGILTICTPAALLLILMLVHNHRLLLSDPDSRPEGGRLSGVCWYVLQMKPVVKFLVLTALCLPGILLLTKIIQ